MATLRLTGFGGEIPKLLPRLLPDMSAQRAFNVRLDDGALTPTRNSRLEHVFSEGSDVEQFKTIYLHAGDWLAWDDEVSATPGPVAQDRLYYTGDGAPKMRVNGVVYPLAVPRPTTALTATANGAADPDADIQTRIYTWTWVTDFGEESEPAGASNEMNWAPGQTATLSGFDAPPTGRNITKQRIYRSQTGSSGGTDLYLIAERPAGSGDFVDTVDPESFQEPLPSASWNAPPDGLQGLVSMPNGMMAAFVGKDLYFCEPWRPHAWPQSYILTMPYEIVGLGAFGTSLAVLTKGTPSVVSGTSPLSMVQEDLEVKLPCVSARSIQDLGYAVVYASADGLVVVSTSGARLVSENLMNPNDWKGLNPDTMVAGQSQGRYLASYAYADLEGREQEGTLIVDMSGEQPFLIRSKIRAASFFYDIPSSRLFYLRSGQILEWDARLETNDDLLWRSKKFILPRPVNFGAILVEGSLGLTDDEVRAIQREIDAVNAENAQRIDDGMVNGAMNTMPLNSRPVMGDDLEVPPPLSLSSSVAIYADDRLIAVVDGINEMHRLPSGFLARQWEIEVSGNTRISQVTLATTGAELMTV